MTSDLSHPHQKDRETEDALNELRDLLSLYPGATPQQICDAVLFLHAAADGQEFTNHCLLAERAALIEALESAGVSDIHGTPLAEVKKKGMPL